MEYHLSARIRELRSLGMPIETWIVRAEAKQLLLELHPKTFPDPLTTLCEDFPFKISNMWVHVFFLRHGFFLRKTRKRMNKIGLTGDLTEKVREFIPGLVYSNFLRLGTQCMVVPHLNMCILTTKFPSHSAQVISEQ